MSDSRLMDSHEMIEEAAREALRFLAVDRVAVGAGDEAAAPWSDGLPELAGERESWQQHVIDELRAALEGKGEETARGPEISSEDPDPAQSQQGEEPVSGKRCKACGVPKDLEEFPKQVVNRDGRAGTCKECRKEQQAARRARDAGQREPSANGAGAEGVAETEEPEKPEGGESVDADSPATSMPSAPAPRIEKRSCANGEKCVAYAQLEEPAKLGRSNNGKVCYPCADAKINGSISPAFGRTRRTVTGS